MASKPTATRASSRTKVAAAAAAKAPAPTRTTRTRAASKAPSTASDATDPGPAKKTTARKPLEKRDNVDVPAPSKSKSKAPSSKSLKQVLQPDAEREPITAYLRIRPQLGEESSSSPYLVPISDTAVKMTDPHDTQNTRPQFRASVASPSSIYTFSHVFPPNTTQQDFFTKTTLPLVKDLLYGQSGLLFTYGVTNSGKTYTVQGGEEKATAGILPRTLDIIFNSIEGLHGEGKYRPVRLYGVEPADAADSNIPQLAPEPDLAEVFKSLDEDTNTDFDADPTTVPVDRNHEYTVWLSYAEVYNEKPAPRAGNSKALLLSRKALTLRPSPPSDNPDAEVNGKYIAGLRQFRIHSASQAKALVKLGQLHRRVFGTLANRESSRSHGMVIIKVVRGHRGDRNDPSALQVSRLTLVDLAGSERTKHTQTTGERLKEAGSINKSLMVLGQCMEVLRSNQRKLAMSLAHEGSGSAGRMDTRDVKRTLAVVPFRHSKLTECLIDYFVGDGRVVMIVNINPYDTGYDENSHVMKFASLAKEIFVTPVAAPLQKAPPVPFMPGKLKGHKFKEPGPLTLKDPEIVPKTGYRRKVTISMGGNEKGKQVNQAILEVLEEDEPHDEGDDDDGDDEPANPLIDALFDEIENLRLQLFEAEMRSAIIEAETREEVMHEMEERMRLMEQKYSRRLMSEMERNEMKTDAKIDMLHQAGLFGSPMKVRTGVGYDSSEDEEEDVEMSLIDYGPEEDEDSDDDMNITAGARSRSASPLTRKERLLSEKQSGKQPASTPKRIVEKREFVPDPAPLPSDTEDAELTEMEEEEENDEEDEDDDEDEDENEMVEDQDDDDDDYDEEEEEEEDDWVPPPPASAKKAAISKASSSARSVSASTPSTTKPKKVSKLANGIDSLSLKSARTQKSPTPAPKKKIRKSALSDSEDEEDVEPEDTPVAPKKKRQLAKKPIMTVDGVEAVTWEAEKLNAMGKKTIRRLGN
ncbi:hypothetical protein EST38_g6927 [Candolleomyces aberdarensis]|uniref:Kinesin-like protein n=1 Tax=Candolleomyces aberdarensis TaxID=2316362 RepID=A0A4V1Q3K7_9AGAR|nr:hypothetical protein EST38_g6927 [Candolleomyces aberdarensis]